MATNVTEKDRTLNEIIEWCERREIRGLRLANALLQKHDMAAYAVVKAQIDAYTRPPSSAALCSVIPGRCRSRSKTRVRTHDEKHPKFCKSSR